MEIQTKSTLFAAIIKVLRPIVKILLRNGIPYKAFADLARWVFMDVAMNEFGIEGRKQTDSRVSILTGFSRKEVKRLRNLKHFSDIDAIHRYNRAARVITGWIRDPQFSTDGRPKGLPFEGGDASFSDPVKQYSNDVPPRAILDELINVKAVEMKRNIVRLLTKAYLPAGDEPAMLSIFGTDVAELIRTIDHNIYHRGDSPYFQRKVSYNNVPDNAAKQFRELSADASQQLLEAMDRWLAEHDRDVTLSVAGRGRKTVGLGIYYFEKDYDDDFPASDKEGGPS